MYVYHTCYERKAVSQCMSCSGYKEVCVTRHCQTGWLRQLSASRCEWWCAVPLNCADHICSNSRVFSILHVLLITKKSLYPTAQDESCNRLWLSYSLLIAMVIKGLTLITTKRLRQWLLSVMTPLWLFSRFKTSIRTYEENKKARLSYVGELNSGHNVSKFVNDDKSITCYGCVSVLSSRGRSRMADSTVICESDSVQTATATHMTQNSAARARRIPQRMWCTKRSQVMTSMKITILSSRYLWAPYVRYWCQFAPYLLESVASAHIVTDRSKFVRFDENFNPNHHTIELADCSKQQNVVVAMGDAKIKLLTLII